MRKAYYAELNGYRSHVQKKIVSENQKHLKKDDQLNVTLFNSLSGIDKETLNIVNDSLKMVKEQANHKIMQMSRIIED
jgi:hypothetical protein